MLAAILLISTVLRPPVAQIGPILSMIESGLHLVQSQTALLASIPVLCFGFGAFASPALVRRFGVDRTLVYLLFVLFVSIALRPYAGFIGLIIGTTLAGLSIAVANVILPSVVRARFPKHVVLLTSAYTTILAASASFAAAFSYSGAIQFGWQLSLAIWALPTLLAFLLSLSLISKKSQAEVEEPGSLRDELKVILKSSIAWSILALFGIQSLGFYALLAWLPTVAADSGMNPDVAGGLLSIMTIVGVPLGLLLSSNFARFKSLAWVGVGVSVITLIGMTFLLLQWWIPAAIVISIGQASSFPLSLSLISTRAATQRLTTMLSSMAQGIGYLIAAAGTFLFGWIETVTGNWEVSVIGLMVLTSIQIVAAWSAGRPRVIK